MTTTNRKYHAVSDFFRVREFLKETYFAFDKPVNWGLERWNWARYHPSVFDGVNPGKTQANIQYWENAVRLWENEAGQIVGIVHVETPFPTGEVFFQRRPGYEFLLDEMFEEAEARHVHKETNKLRIPIYEFDAPLVQRAVDRGYVKQPKNSGHNAVFTIEDLPSKNLPAGFKVLSMAEGGDLAKRCKVQGLGFNHPDPAEWTTPVEYQEVQQAPDYRPEMDLFVVGPDGEYVTCCIVWFDDANKAGYFEPVCTHPDYRRRGFGREVMIEGMRRLKALGANRAYVGSSQEFYKAVGFELKYKFYYWVKTIPQ